MADGYGSLIGGKAVFAGVDQGIDFTGHGPVYALGKGVITRMMPSGSGWPGEGALLVYKIIEGPAKGRSVYIAEDFRALTGLKVGSVVTQGQALGVATGSGKAPGIEVGWANDAGHAIAPLNGRTATQPGYSFQAFVQSAATVVDDSGANYDAGAAAATQPTSTGPEASTLIQQDLAAQPPPPGSIQANSVEQPMPYVSGGPPPQYETWKTLSQLPGASPDTLRLAQMSGYANAGT